VFDRLLQVIEIVDRFKLPCSVITNCYWATDEKIAKKKLKELHGKGLSTLYVSLSPYHQQQLPLSNFRIALKEALEQGMSTGVLYQYHGEKKTGQIVMLLKELLGNDLYGKINYLNSGPILAMGRALEKLDPKLLSHTHKKFCNAIGPSLFLNGDITGCCGDIDPTRSHFRLGNLSEEKFAALIDRMRNNRLIPYISFIGFDETEKLLREKGIITGESPDIPGYALCRRCRAIANNPDALKYLSENVQAEHIATVGIKQAISYGRQFFRFF
jgi:hypothetical protein